MKKTLLLVAFGFVGTALTPALACDYHATHTTAAESSTVVVCDAGGCRALETSTAQREQQSTAPTVVAAEAPRGN